MRAGFSKRRKEEASVLWVALHRMSRVRCISVKCVLKASERSPMLGRAHVSALPIPELVEKNRKRKTEKVLRTIFTLKKKKALPSNFYLNFSPALPASLSLSLLLLLPPLPRSLFHPAAGNKREERASGTVSCSSPSRFRSVN